MALLKIQKPSVEQSKINTVFVNPSHLDDSKCYAILDSTFLFAVDSSSDIPSKSLLLSKIQREFVKIDLEKTMDVEFLDQGYFQAIDTLSLEIESLSRGKVTLDASTLISVIKTKYEQFPFNSGQRLYIEISPEDVGETCTGLDKPCIFILAVNALVADGSRAAYGILTEMTDVSVESNSSGIEITDSHGIRKSLSFEELGIGGLKKEFEQMFRRAFVQRLFDSEFVSKFGVSNVKGIMLYGPPGTGKTLIARKLGSLLNARPPQIVNGPEILNRYVGQSEENIRRLFAAAEEEYKLKGEKSQLHIIIFDEIDAICKKRGSSGGAGVGDQVVNQLLSKIDGVEALNNILVIGMTNRLDLIDEALLRPGRFEIHLEISLPDEAARAEIFAIHTKTMAKNDFMDGSVDTAQLAVLSRNYTGAEIAAVVRGAVSYALERRAGAENNKLNGNDIKNNENENNNDDSNNGSRVNMHDMLLSLSEIKPAFGVSEEELSAHSTVFYETEGTRSAQNTAAEMMAKLRTTNLYKTNSLLFAGETGTGKTVLAVRSAKASEFPYIKIISPVNLVGLSEGEKVNFIKDRFMDAYKSEEACVILDDIEGLIEYTGIGPRFSNAILQAIKIFVKREGRHKLFVLGTTAMPEVLEACGLLDSFSETFSVPRVSDTDYQSLCEQNASFSSIDYKTHLPIKRLLAMLPDADLSLK